MQDLTDTAVDLAIPTNSTAPAFELRDVSMRFGAVQALSPVTLRIEPGERVAIVGPSGAGKDDAALPDGGNSPACRG